MEGAERGMAHAAQAAQAPLPLCRARATLLRCAACAAAAQPDTRGAASVLRATTLCAPTSHTCVSLAQPFVNMGLSGRSTRREVSTSASRGRPSRLMKPPLRARACVCVCVCLCV